MFSRAAAEGHESSPSPHPTPPPPPPLTPLSNSGNYAPPPPPPPPGSAASLHNCVPRRPQKQIYNAIFLHGSRLPPYLDSVTAPSGRSRHGAPRQLSELREQVHTAHRRAAGDLNACASDEPCARLAGQLSDGRRLMNGLFVRATFITQSSASSPRRAAPHRLTWADTELCDTAKVTLVYFLRSLT
ncbi:BEN domain-containing protein 4-like [Schistocerca gregaria]|uniref:BEN domain-containing protein 4-like n=1 Tax=Schistocerca gregaria TaxID=7010 RepID=UPI00211E502F|nr:BEN domain-containing protein 4-like [Schistocerca gregaria]